MSRADPDSDTNSDSYSNADSVAERKPNGYSDPDLAFIQ
jgi:hypothetical protein